MKNFKRITSALAALTIAACAAAPMAMTSMVANAESIKVTEADLTINGLKANHTFKAYKIFDANVTKEDNGDLIVDTVKWATGVNGDDIVDALKKANITIPNPKANEASQPETINPFANITDAQSVADALKNITNKDDIDKIADIFYTNKGSATGIGGEYTEPTAEGNGSDGKVEFKKLPAGYYLVVDETTEMANGDAFSKYILQLVGDATLNIKSAAPTVDKQVKDEEEHTSNENSTAKDNGDGWYESADHQINESFQFKLTATLDPDTNYADYEEYKVVFNDTFSDGVVFEDIVSINVTVKDGATKSLIKDETAGGRDNLEDGVTFTQGEKFNNHNSDEGGDCGGSFSITINDLKNWVANGDITKGVTIEVVYSAHLDKHADVEKEATTASSNENKVNLEYSNNPNASGSGTLGKTPDDSVWVFTYEVDNVKTDENGDELGGAQFQLKSGDTPLKFIYEGDGVYTVADQSKDVTRNADEDYVAGDIVDTVKSEDGTGIFNFKGLDVGTYTLTETKAPAGYNLADPITIEITATHNETEAGTGSAGTLKIKATQNEETAVIVGEGAKDGTNAGKVQIIDQKGGKLPSTGGMGTTIFYLGGGALVAVAGVMLITKKRMSKNEE